MNGYEIISVLGEGGSSVVYLVQQQDTGNQYVMKRFFHSIVNEEWKREVSILERLQHPQIPNYIDDFLHRVEGRTLPHLIMEHISGQKLETLKSSFLSNSYKISNILRSILGVLSYTHTLLPPVIHRDIKPSNIVIGDDGGVYLIDFGVATEDRQYTAGHSIMTGTFGFQAPEQIIGDPTVKSDIYSVGVLCVYLFTGIPPHKMITAHNYILNWREHCVSSIGRTSQSDNWWMWLEGMLEEDVEKRFGFEQAILHLPKVIASDSENNSNITTNPFLQKLNEVQEEDLYQKNLQREREIEEKRQQFLENEKRQVLQKRINQKKKAYLDELRVAWSEMIRSIEKGTLGRADAVRLFWDSYKDIRFVEVDGEKYSIKHPIFELVEHLIQTNTPKKESFFDKVKSYLVVEESSIPTLSIDVKVYWLFIEQIFDVSEVHMNYKKIRQEYIQHTIKLEFMDPYSRYFGKEGKDLESKIAQLEKAIAMKQKTFYDLHEAMKPYFFFTDKFHTYKNRYFDKIIQQQNQRWEISFIEQMSGEEKLEHQSDSDFREFALTQHAYKIQRKYMLYITIPIVTLMLVMLSFYM